MSERMIRVLSLGAGVQSSTVALMCAAGEIEPVDCAIFADTGAEPASVYRWLDWLEARLPFPVHRVMWAAGLERNILGSISGGRFACAPFFTESERDAGGGQLRRQCTREFKIQPITQKVRELVGLVPGERAPRGKILATQVFGVSWDEAYRMRTPREPWIANEYPLVEREMTRGHCLEWMQRHGYPRPPTQITHPTNRSRPDDRSPQLMANSHPPAMAINLRGREGGAMPEAADLASLRAASGGSSRSFIVQTAVRRITPREAEPLQGFPDDYTLIPFRGKPAADTPRYKAIGNSMAVPVMRWIGERIELVTRIAEEIAA